MLDECRRQFEDLTGLPFSDEWANRHRSAATRLKREDQVGRQALRNQSRRLAYDAVIERCVAGAGNAAPALAAAAIAAMTGSLRTAHRPSPAGIPLYNGIRAYVIHTFEVCASTEAATDPKWPFPEPRVITDHELAVLSLVLEIEQAKISAADAENDVTPGTIIDRERRAMERARDHHGQFRTAREKASALDAARRGVRARLP